MEASRRAVLAGLGAAAVSVTMAGTAVASPRRSAATVLHNGIVYTGVSNCPPAEAIAVGRDGRILAVGTGAELLRRLGRDTEAIDLKGGLVMPGLHDGHIHPIEGGAGLHTPSLDDATLTVPQIISVVTAALNASTGQEPDGWLQIANWNSAGVLPPGTVVHKRDLDALPTRRPIFVGSSDHHNAWVNSRALALAGITKDTPNPPGGTIVRDAAGEPTGLLKDDAVNLVQQVIPPLTFADLVAAATEAYGMLAAAGVTTVMDATANDQHAEVFKALAANGKLSARTHMAYRVEPDKAADPKAILAVLQAFRQRHQGVDRLSAGIAKVFMDGVIEYPAQTAALLEPYLVDGKPSANYGQLYFDQKTISAFVSTLDKAGWQVHAHTIGDRAVRTALNAYEVARLANGDRDNRHTLAHVQLIDPSDIARVARAKVLCCLQLQWAGTNFYSVDALLPYVGAERQGRIYAARTLERAGVRLTGGTDFPVDPFNPWAPVSQAITRAFPDGSPALHPEQGLSRESSLRMHTFGTAFQLHQEHLTGTLEPGKQADLVLTDRDVTRIAPADIHNTKALLTMVGGEIVHQGPAPVPPAIAARNALLATGAPADRRQSHAACGHG
ncbi:amidohydrolase [Kutzneria sp. CA-103260]|uniref:amidohydrolase n=1 Tax=Kutzneria sp. CA-103260 TaxID=2802641 RepID=UPI001BA684DB|nr:amidohydrolase [Kutzneria sp. CA-103260]QUQ65868.1 amidohydrolase [Kutzneria sp. CA-103260]